MPCGIHRRCRPGRTDSACLRPLRTTAICFCNVSAVLLTHYIPSAKLDFAEVTETAKYPINGSEPLSSPQPNLSSPEPNLPSSGSAVRERSLKAPLRGPLPSSPTLAAVNQSRGFFFGGPQAPSTALTSPRLPKRYLRDNTMEIQKPEKIGIFASKMAHPLGFEPRACCLEGSCSIRLSYGCSMYAAVRIRTR